MKFTINVCPGVKKRVGAYIGAGGAVAIALFLVVLGASLLPLSYREEEEPARKRAVGGLYAVCTAVIACWAVLCFVLFVGIRVENKRALLVWLYFSAIFPALFLSAFIYMAAMGHFTAQGTAETVYFVIMGISILILVWIGLAILSYYYEILERDKNPGLRSMPDANYTNPYFYTSAPSEAAGGYGAGSQYGGGSTYRGGPGGGYGHDSRSVRSDFRSQAPSHAPSHGQSHAPSHGPSQGYSAGGQGQGYSAGGQGQGYNTGRSEGKFSDYPGPRDQPDARSGRSAYRPEASGSRSRDHSAEREGGGAYYRYQYTAGEGRGRRNSGGSQHSLIRPGQQQQRPAKDSVV